MSLGLCALVYASAVLSHTCCSALCKADLVCLSNSGDRAELLSYRTEARTGDRDQRVLQSQELKSFAELQQCFESLQWTPTNKAWCPGHDAFHFVFILIWNTFSFPPKEKCVLACSFPFNCFILPELLMTEVAAICRMPQQLYSNRNGIGVSFCMSVAGVATPE